MECTLETMFKIYVGGQPATFITLISSHSQVLFKSQIRCILKCTTFAQLNAEVLMLY
jgi:hypothetical protein